MCLERYARKDVLDPPKMIHTANKPYECKYCDFRSRYRGSRNKHEETQHFTLQSAADRDSEVLGSLDLRPQRLAYANSNSPRKKSSSIPNDVALRKTLNNSNPIDASACNPGSAIAQYDLSIYQEEYQRSGQRTTFSNTYGIREQPSSACTRVSAQDQHHLPSIHKKGLMECRMREAAYPRDHNINPLQGFAVEAGAYW
ncbi:hypothetical protein CABS01_17014 [Colletotrichum abscissum]|uniref:uncharacterized protein n=1 Tax=Colletotrichum abscissum TaxID=1671311 RepID=UPI0027D75DDF|nr:uncharacterized protein CABS01_17014 [Colletotrichum abscissum]KAK1500035.1 hypothetical protein CABS01_17014 [Colletotrichum abscissum]